MASMITSLTLQDEISGFRGGVAGDKSLLRLGAVLLGEQFPTFQKIMILSKLRELLAERHDAISKMILILCS
jgi:hypothetical protein